MIIQCKSCLRKFAVKEKDIPEEGRTVECGYCSVSWHQMPVYVEIKINEIKTINKTSDDTNENLSVEKIKASDGSHILYNSQYESASD
jgi:predicted Zn finger-like uncharacterized protein